MHQRARMTLFPLKLYPLEYLIPTKASISEVFSLTPFRVSGPLFVQIMHKSSGGRPKKKIYHRVHDLDRVMELQKKPSLILQLKTIIQSQKNHSLLLRDLEKEVGIVQKWNFMTVIEKYPSIFHVSGGNRTPLLLKLTEKAKKIAAEETNARILMEPILVKKLRKLLMMSMDCQVPLEKIEFIESELGLPRDFKEILIPKYPEFFSVKDINGRAFLILETWDSSLGTTAREEKLAYEGISKFGGCQDKATISKDGNFSGPFAFRLSFPAGFRPNMNYLKGVQQWQKMSFPSPYLNGRRFELGDPKARKRAVAVLHELLGLTMEKRMSSAQLDAFRAEYQLPCKLLFCLVKHNGIFYITNKGAKSTVFLKEAYDGSNLIEKCPLVMFNDKFIGLSGRRDLNSCNGMPSSQIST
ncbi:hypothetical protein HHK36_007030 [Tetracentron sinense]|uniref:PORR domain-containing protein n=1 Tax=Tetracentron sinense TaxID=13715 RepID=A0A834ZK51_TETSI|nr:hypothetical protein HHK36_007030 [Tetracentron sinense]